MLDLNKLEQEIDNFVETITKEELDSFFEEEKNLTYFALLGNGEIRNKENVTCFFNVTDKSSKASKNNSINQPINYDLAA